MISVRLEPPMKVEIPQLKLFVLDSCTFRRGWLKIRRWREYAAAWHFRARLLQTSGVPVAPSSLNTGDRHTGHRLQHLASLLRLLDRRLLFLRLHRLNFPRHFRWRKNLGHCDAPSHAHLHLYTRVHQSLPIRQSDFSFERRRAGTLLFTRGTRLLR